MSSIQEKICSFLLIRVPWLLYYISCFIPIQTNLIIFMSWPDKGGNSKALYNFIKNQGDWDLKWVIHERTTYNADSQSFYKYSYKALLYLMRAKYIFNSNNGLERFNKIVKKNQKYINLWHGMPLKTIYALDKNNFQTPAKRKAMSNTLYPKHDIWCSTSEFYQVVLASAFQTDITYLPITGQPRNDLLFDKKSSKRLLDSIYNTNGYHKVILYAPTYCKIRDNINVDDFRFIQIENCELNIFNEFLANNGYLLFIKMHPADEDLYSNNIKAYSNIKFIHRFDLQKYSTDIDEILGAFDMLITDYSSIYIDFLLTNKPIIFTKANYDEYFDKRGWIFGNEYDFFCPGPKCSNYNELITSIKTEFEKDTYYFEREKIKNLFHKYQDGKSCERIYKLIRENIKVL